MASKKERGKYRAHSLLNAGAAAVPEEAKGNWYMCHGKRAYERRAEAERMRRLTPNGGALSVYKCLLGPHYHIGRTVPTSKAAAAKRAEWQGHRAR